ncbi:hypothetical protein OSTOST_01588, partial [Ostertagia ostertagi]
RPAPFDRVEYCSYIHDRTLRKCSRPPYFSWAFADFALVKAVHRMNCYAASTVASMELQLVHLGFSQTRSNNPLPEGKALHIKEKSDSSAKFLSRGRLETSLECSFQGAHFCQKLASIAQKY